MTVNRNNVNQKHAYLRKNKPAQLLRDDILKKFKHAKPISLLHY